MQPSPATTRDVVQVIELMHGAMMTALVAILDEIRKARGLSPSGGILASPHKSLVDRRAELRSHLARVESQIAGY
jgi:hypothetical protein